MNSRDPFGELKPHRALPSGLKQRFPDRVLVMTTDRCFGACPHCTRKFILGKSRYSGRPYRLHQPLFNFPHVLLFEHIAVLSVDYEPIVYLIGLSPVNHLFSYILSVLFKYSFQKHV